MNKLSLSILIIVFNLYNHQSCLAQPSDETILRTLNNAEREARLKGDTLSLFKLYSEDLVFQNPANQIITLPEIKKRMRNGEIIGASFERDIEKITLVKNIAIIMGKEIVIPKIALQDGKTVTRRYTNVWMKESGTWKLIARQATIIATE